ncbi:MAG: ferrous iron transport protein B [Candidatus Thermoplasmatota archaeon]|nr:ferrous iron transport protein B [Candidatus Thermoplasmatota archaeon]
MNGCAGCGYARKGKCPAECAVECIQGKKINLMLAGNANVGKSVIFNHLTQLHQHIGNWPGKTVEKAEGTLQYKGRQIDVIDLPGIYSLSTFSIEERVSREYIASRKSDIVVNVVDASALERNLIFTIQLAELGKPMIIALNQIDLAEKKGIFIDDKKLEEALGVPVVRTVAIKGRGIDKILDTAIAMSAALESGTNVLGTRPKAPEFGKEIEEKISITISAVGKHGTAKTKYPKRYFATKLLEGDEEISEIAKKIDTNLIETAKACASGLESAHGEACPLVMSYERSSAAKRIAEDVVRIEKPHKPPLSERIDAVTTHPILGYLVMLAILAAVFVGIFSFGNFLSSALTSAFGLLDPWAQRLFGAGALYAILWEGGFTGLVAGITIALPYIVPFYLVLEILENSGYLARIAFLTDSIMHKMGLHGKAIIPMMLGYGCTVPACLGCRILETERERLIAIFVTTLIPCAARTVVIMGLVGAYMGLGWALALYAIDIALVFILGRLAFKVLPGEPTGLIMEMPEYKMPSIKTALYQTWGRTSDFVFIAFPIIIIGGILLKILELIGAFGPISAFMNPVIGGWLGLPAAAGIVLIFGILRKELALIMLAALVPLSSLTHVQMFVFALVCMIYIPCVSTIGALIREIGWKKTLYISLAGIGLALLLGGIAARVLPLLGV